MCLLLIMLLKQSVNQTFSGTATHQLQNSFTCYSASTLITHTAGTLDYNGKTQTNGNFSTTGATARTITFGAAILNLNGTTGFVYSSSGLTITANSAVVTFNNTGPSVSLNGANWNGLSIVIAGAAGIANVQKGTVANFYVLPITTKTITFASGAVVTCTGNIYLDGTAVKLITVNSAGGTVGFSKTSGTAYFYGCKMTGITCSGGATFKAINSYQISGCSGITFTPAILYLDAALSGVDTNDTPYGWWKRCIYRCNRSPANS